MANFIDGIVRELSRQFPTKKIENKTTRAYDARIERAKEKVRAGKYMTASDLMSNRYDFGGEKGLTREEKNAAVARQKRADERMLRKPRNTYTLAMAKGAVNPVLKDEAVKEKQVASTAIGRVRYNPETKDLYVRFRNGTGKDYLFPNVDKRTVQNFLSAGSKGKFYWKRVRPFRVSKEDALAIKAKNKNK